MSKPRYWLIVPAAGSGQRMKADCPKQYLKLDQQYILDITLSRLLGHADFSGCVVAIRADDPWWPETMASSDTRIDTCSGGAERADSVLAALDARVMTIGFWCTMRHGPACTPMTSNDC